MTPVVKFVCGVFASAVVALVGVPAGVMLAIALEIPLPTRLVALVGYWTHFLIYTGVLHVVLVPLILLIAGRHATSPARRPWSMPVGPGWTATTPGTHSNLPAPRARMTWRTHVSSPLWCPAWPVLTPSSATCISDRKLSFCWLWKIFLCPLPFIANCILKRSLDGRTIRMVMRYDQAH
jgi:hypothetical protein